jgi:type IV pilus assembly protein PilV
MNTIRRNYSLRSRTDGFTLIEVMIAILVLGFGLLGYALLQTMSVRFAQSANYRTQATNLSYELLDQIRVNRVVGASYVGAYPAAATGCVSAVQGTNVSAANFRAAWSCKLRRAIGEGASATVTRVGNTYTVNIIWDDDRREAGVNAPDFRVGAEI